MIGFLSFIFTGLRGNTYTVYGTSLVKRTLNLFLAEAYNIFSYILLCILVQLVTALAIKYLFYEDWEENCRLRRTYLEELERKVRIRTPPFPLLTSNCNVFSMKIVFFPRSSYP
jgi:hypothetical protein